MKESCDDGCAHALLEIVLLAGIEDRGVCLLDGAPEMAPCGREIFGDTVNVGVAAVLFRCAEVVEHEVDAHPAGDFTGLGSAHAIADHINPEALVPTEVVFVVGAHAAYVGPASGFEHEVHALSRVLPWRLESFVHMTLPAEWAHWKCLARYQRFKSD